MQAWGVVSLWVATKLRNFDSVSSITRSNRTTRSPYFFLDKINAPAQMICGANDPRCPASESVDARDKLVELGKEVDLLLYPDEGHSFLKIENILDSEIKRMEFLAKVLESE